MNTVLHCFENRPAICIFDGCSFTIQISFDLNQYKEKYVVSSAIFLKKMGSGTLSDRKFGRRGGVITMPGEKVPERRSGLRILREHFRDGVSARSVTKIPLNINISGATTLWSIGLF
jgi:hypothetical protein